jgi:hypothetical protein
VFFVVGAQDEEHFVADIRTVGGFSASKPRLMFNTLEYAGNGPCRTWDVSPDGQHFLMIKLGEQKAQPVTELILVQNWFEELKRLAPAPSK